MSRKLFSIVIPIYKAVPNLPHTIPYIMENIPKLFPDYDVELIMVNDGSPDDSWNMMKEYQRKYPETVRIARFVHNCGQGVATYHGIKMAKGDVIGVISQDMQDPFELFVDMLKEHEKGYELVCAVRKNREEKGLAVQCSKVTHYLMHKFVSSQYPIGGCDFYVLDRCVADRFLRVYQKSSILLSLLRASGATQYIPYTRQERKYGKSGYNLARKINGFIGFFVSNTYLPLRVMSIAGFIFAGIAFLFAIVVFITALFNRSPIPVNGWASLALLITFFSGLILAALGIVGEYLWRVYDEAKKMPLYLVAETVEGQMTVEENAVNAGVET